MSALKRLRKAVATARAVRECGHKVLGTRAAFESGMRRAGGGRSEARGEAGWRFIGLTHWLVWGCRRGCDRMAGVAHRVTAC